MSIYLIISLFLLALPVQAAPDCGPEERSAWQQIQARSKYLSYEESLPAAIRDPDSYVRFDPDYRDLYVRGDLAEGGRLEITIYTKQGNHYGNLRAKYEMQNIMNHFGSRVKLIEGNWTTEAGPDFSNLDQFNEAITAVMAKAGISSPNKLNQEIIAEAVFSTWTGKQAKKYGYTEIKKIGLKVSDDPARLFQSVAVEFVRAE